MEYQDVFSVVAKCFAPVERGEWTRLTSAVVWSEFLDAARSALQDARPSTASSRARLRFEGPCPLQEFLAVGEVNALFCPPTFAEKQAFAARHFTGGLPASALPIESLYVRKNGVAASGIARHDGAYLGEPALYMRDLIVRMGLSASPAFASCPDHLALELEMEAELLERGMVEEARQFFVERFEWLTCYRMKLLELDDDARFYIGLVDVLMGVWAKHIPEDFEEENA